MNDIINSRDSLGKTALHLAAANNNPHYEMFHTLLKHPKLNPNLTQTESGWTVMHQCLYSGKLVLALGLLKARPDTDLLVRDKEGIRCLELLNVRLKLCLSVANRWARAVGGICILNLPIIPTYA